MALWPPGFNGSVGASSPDQETFPWSSPEGPGTPETPRPRSQDPQTGTALENRPIEPEGRSIFRGGTLKWVFFLLFILYALVSQYHEPLLKAMGTYLVKADAPRGATLAVLSLGAPVEGALTAAELYRKGLFKTVFVGRASPPDGVDALRQEHVPYQEERDQVLLWLKTLGVPLNACLLQDDFLSDMEQEAVLVKRIAAENAWRSVAVITSPVRSRRLSQIYERVLGQGNVQITVIPSTYSTFDPGQWWQSPHWRTTVLSEYVNIVLDKACHLF